MTALRRHLADYLETRHAHGFKTKRSAWLLGSFVSFLEKRRLSAITSELALAWAKQPAGAHPGWWAERLSGVRVFARYVHFVDVRHEIPPRDLLRGRTLRTTPHLYSQNDIERILRGARKLQSPLRRATHETLFGLLAATGMRVGEALRLDREDVDWSNRLLTIHESKFRKSREVALHASVVRALRRYEIERDRLIPRTHSAAFFVSLSGTRLIYNNVHQTFARVLRRAGIKRKRARLHDLRHTFAVGTVLRWHRRGVDVDARMPRLSTYLGHSDPSSTYWYLTASPELLALLGRKVQRALGDLR